MYLTVEATLTRVCSLFLTDECLGVGISNSMKTLPCLANCTKESKIQWCITKRRNNNMIEWQRCIGAVESSLRSIIDHTLELQNDSDDSITITKLVLSSYTDSFEATCNRLNDTNATICSHTISIIVLCKLMVLILPS